MGKLIVVLFLVSAVSAQEISKTTYTAVESSATFEFSSSTVPPVYTPSQMRIYNEYLKKITSPVDLARRQAVYEIIHSTLPFAVPLLEEAIKGKGIYVRRMAISGLGNFINGESLAVLRNCLNDKTAIIRADSVRALANFPKEIIQPDILRMLDDKSFIVIKEALEAVSSLGIFEAKDKILEFLKNRSPILKAAALDAAAEMKIPEALSYARKIALKDKSASVRKKALLAVSQIGGAESLDVLKDALKDSDLDVALESAFILAKNFDPAGEKIAAKAAVSENPQLRLKAAKILLFYDDADSRETLKKMLKDPDKSVREFVRNNMEVTK
ncbi:MAG: HEAT repeat domain-containing protein [Elusimicrobia bacterium]|nr:HEAT repeat domain-containing protein [Elusimicrobiota bacterium]